MPPCSTVTAQQTFDPSQVSVTNISLSSNTVTEGEAVTATATVSNNNGTAAAADVIFTLDGGSQLSCAVNPPANGSDSCSVQYVITSTGDHQICAEVTNVAEDPGSISP